jgi:cell division protease FtsH
LTEHLAVHKRGNNRGRLWLSSGPIGIGAVLAGSMLLFWLLVREAPFTTLKYGEFVQVLEASRRDPGVSLRDVKVGHNDIRGDIVLADPVVGGPAGAVHSQTVSFRAQRVGLEDDPQLTGLLRETLGGAWQGEEEESVLRSAALMVLPVVVLLACGVALLLLLRWMTGASPLTFGRSKAKIYAQKDLHVTFQDVAGIDEAVAELREVVDFLKTPEKYQALGGRIPKGVLLVGPPGTGKTLLAKAVAGEADVPFFSLSGSEFVEMFVGVGAARVRDLFAQGDSRAPCIIFIDELDALGKTRSGIAVGGHDEREQTLNQLLVEMDGFDSNRGVIIMAATNRPETLDAALLRPGRFDRQVVVDRPDINGREAILKVHTRNVRLGLDVDLRRIAALTPGAVGADLANLVNEAALMAARAGKQEAGMADFEEAVERGAVGLERKSRIMSAEEKQRVAYHEAGHALVSASLPNTHPVHKISIIPRGVGALGYVLSRPDEDRYLVTQKELESKIKVALGGTLAEELIFQEVSNGATSDLEQVSRIARSMVKEFGMSRLGRVNFHERSATFLQHAMGDGDRQYSEQTAREIDVEVHRIIDEATHEVREVLRARRAVLEAVAKRLMEKEVMDGAELRLMVEQYAPELPAPQVEREGTMLEPGAGESCVNAG